jgi:predicted transcriptional regulator
MSEEKKTQDTQNEKPRTKPKFTKYVKNYAEAGMNWNLRPSYNALLQKNGLLFTQNYVVSSDTPVNKLTYDIINHKSIRRQGQEDFIDGYTIIEGIYYVRTISGKFFRLVTSTCHQLKYRNATAIQKLLTNNSIEYYQV